MVRTIELSSSLTIFQLEQAKCRHREGGGEGREREREGREGGIWDEGLTAAVRWLGRRARLRHRKDTGKGGGRKVSI